MVKLMIKAGLFVFFSAAAGCYASSASHGDGASDPAGEHDAHPDWPPESFVDLPPDPPPPDVVPDIPPDIPFYCTPPGEASVAFRVEEGPYGDPPYDLERDCIVDWTGGEEPGIFDIGLNCSSSSGESEIYTVSVSSYPAIRAFLPTGAPVTFAYMVEEPWWLDRWFYIRYSDGSLFMAGVDAETLIRRDVDPDFWYDPLVVRLADGLCPPVPEECGDLEREAIDVTLDGMTARVFDGNEGMVESMALYQIIADRAMVYRNVTCDDFPDSWISALFVSLPVR
jgi:hypothetical protein